MELHLSRGDHPDADVGEALAVDAVVPYGGRVSELITGLKYDGETGNARFLGHLLFRHLDRQFLPNQVDLVLPNPTYLHRGIRHTELTIAAMAAANVDQRWTFDDPSNPCLAKVRATVNSYGQDEAGHRRAAEAMERALEVRRPELVHGRRLLVVDDVVTTGEQLRAIARTLRAHGAEVVRGLVVAHVGLADQAAEVASARSTTAVRRLEELGDGHDRPDGLSL